MAEEEKEEEEHENDNDDKTIDWYVVLQYGGTVGPPSAISYQAMYTSVTSKLRRYEASTISD